MPPKKAQEHPLRMLPALWGFDVAFAAFCWAFCGAEHMQITMVSEGPILLLVVGVWVYTVVSRTRSAIGEGSGWYRGYYESHAVPMLLLAACAAAAGGWMLCYYVGQHVLGYACIPAFFLIPALLPTRRAAVFRGLCKSLAFGFACMVPAFSMSFEQSPLHMLFCGPCWYIGILFFLYQQERVQWKDDSRAPHSHSRLLLAGLFCLLLVCALSADSRPYFEHSICLTIAMGAACLLLLARMPPISTKRASSAFVGRL